MRWEASGLGRGEVTAGVTHGGHGHGQGGDLSARGEADRGGLWVHRCLVQEEGRGDHAADCGAVRTARLTWRRSPDFKKTGKRAGVLGFS